MNREWIVNASPVITLARAGRLELLLGLCPNPQIPPAVAREIRKGPDVDPARAWMETGGARFITGSIQVKTSVAAWKLGSGETEVLSLALNRIGSKAILDDRAARQCGLAHGVAVMGSLGLIILAKREGIIPRVSGVFNDLTAAGMRIDSSILKRALSLAGE